LSTEYFNETLEFTELTDNGYWSGSVEGEFRISLPYNTMLKNNIGLFVRDLSEYGEEKEKEEHYYIIKDFQFYKKESYIYTDENGEEQEVIYEPNEISTSPEKMIVSEEKYYYPLMERFEENYNNAKD
jgi:hypothetical protein